MTTIQNIQASEHSELKQFKDREYPEVDRAHYGEDLPDFNIYTFTLIAKDEEEIVGYIKVQVELGVAMIKSLLVGAQARRRGVGSQLVQAAEQEAKKMKAHKIWLETGEKWEARHVYVKLGYREFGRLENYYGKQHFLLFEKEL